MENAHLEVADVLRLHLNRFFKQYGDKLTGWSLKVLTALLRCSTGALGTHLKKCTNCSQERYGANTCRNRHCPKCQGGRTAEWVEKRSEELLNTSYFHIVFTIPDKFNRLFLANKRTLGDIFFLAVKETLLEIGASEKYLGAQIGFYSVLHTWGSKMDLHPHLRW